MRKNKNLKPLDEFIDESYGKRGTDTREEFEKGTRNLRPGR